jgi:hypothetical protein
VKLSCVKQNLNNKHWSVKRVLHEVYTIDRSCSLAPEKVVPGNTKLEQLGSNHLAAPNTGPVAPVTRMLDGPKLFFCDSSVYLQESHTQNQSGIAALVC